MLRCRVAQTPIVVYVPEARVYGIDCSESDEECAVSD